MKATLILAHGWGFDASVWDALCARLPGARAHRGEAGYFGAPVGALPALAPPGAARADPAGPVRAPAPEEPAGAAVIAIGHSQGGLDLLTALPAGCTHLVLINGFGRFCAAPDHPDGVPARMLERMLSRLAREPQAVVDDFRARCGAAPAAGPPEPQRLAHGLQRLRDADLRATLAALPLPTLLLAGETDPIAPPALSRATAVRDTRWHPGGHLLPLADPAWCAQQIRDFVAATP
ncbi:alpha/beta hydrolase [Bordetella genomosp. 1]|uniref:Alpha/beta hydrolase n=1 Tax=Bordetella genomosp. 1 TaxID=1395607 RepID=A0A261SHX4_9BORD|nr:alpha/beta fold hydrolase [Bordetella genomosp. 1]OZI36587.1 alpha/beta hydrolase [Bordetella genomosp. 1]